MAQHQRRVLIGEAGHVALVDVHGRPYGRCRALGLGLPVHVHDDELEFHVVFQAGQLHLRMQVLVGHPCVLEHLREEEIVGHVELDLGAPLHLAQGHDMAHQDAEQVLEPFGQGRGMARHGERPEVGVVEVKRPRQARIRREARRRLDVVCFFGKALTLLLDHLRRQAAGLDDVAVQVVREDRWRWSGQ